MHQKGLWAYGSGFPKATNISKQIEPNQKIIGVHPNPNATGWVTSGKAADGHKAYITEPQTELAAQWEGHRYGLQALKPATEPILCFQKPYVGRPLDSITKTGAGALNIDGGRIGTVGGGGNGLGSHFNKLGNTEPLIKHSKDDTNTKGRWPSNLILSHHPDCKKVGVKKVRGEGGRNIIRKSRSNFSPGGNYEAQKYHNSDGFETVADWQCVDNCPVKRLGEQSGVLKSGALDQAKIKVGGGQVFKLTGYSNPKQYERSEGTASRFFYQSHFAYEIAEQIAVADPVRYVAKAGKKERNAGLDELPLSPTIFGKNLHPTVKPIALTKYLASLLLPPKAYAPRKILMPFSGSGSNEIGGLLAGWDEVTGIEMTKKYIPIAKARLEWWLCYLRWGQNDIDTILDAIHTDDGQLSFIEEIE